MHSRTTILERNLGFLVSMGTVLFRVQKHPNDREQCGGIHDAFSTYNSVGSTVAPELVVEHTQIV